MKNFSLLQIIIICAFFVFIISCGFAENAVILVDPKSEINHINKKVFGGNLIAYDPMTYEDWAKEYRGYSDYGAGMWDPRLKKSVKEVIDLAKESGMSVARFPGGCGTHRYNWKHTIGDNRKHFLYGLDEFLKTCEEMGAEPIITVSYFAGDEHDAADLVEYLNTPADQNSKWAKMRAENGHSQPYNVKYFEIGNEVWHGDHREIKEVTPEEYAHGYLKYYTTMKSVNPLTNIGIVLCYGSWNGKVLKIIKDNVDFGIIHIYPGPGYKKDEFMRVGPEDVFRKTLGPALLDEEAKLREVEKDIKKILNKPLPLAITEYNGGFWQDKPLPYRHCLGTALLNAELLRIFMKPEHNILMANYWQFCNSYWGAVANEFDGINDNLYEPYYKRPSFYAFELYHKHFGDILISSRTDCPSYNTVHGSVPYLSVNASKNEEEKKVYLMVINKSMSGSIAASIRLDNFKAAKIEAWVLNGPRIESLNEKTRQEVKIRHVKTVIKDKVNDNFDFTFEPHSLTAIEINGE